MLGKVVREERTDCSADMLTMKTVEEVSVDLKRGRTGIVPDAGTTGGESAGTSREGPLLADLGIQV